MTNRRPLRTNAAVAKRRPGIDYEGVPASLVGRAIEPGDAGYHRYTSSYLRSGAPGLVLRPRTPEETQDAVRFADTHREVPLGILSAGHGLSGRSLNHGGLVIDVGAINHVDPLGGGRVNIGPGARWIDVARVLTPLGLAISSGDYGGVGVGGLATAGGIGWFAREHGLTVDRLRSVDVVTSDGSLVRASADENPDLFWAMRGAGANFGIAVSFEFEANPVGQVGFAQLTFAIRNVSAFIRRWGAAIEAADRSVSATVLLSATRPGQLTYAMASVVVDSDQPSTVVERLQPILDVDRVANQSVVLASYAEVIGAFFEEGATQQGQGEPHSHSALVRHLDAEVSGELAELLESGASHFFTIRSVGGAVADVAAADTAYGWRDANFSLVAFGSPNSGIDRWWASLQPHFEGMYLSFESDTGPDSLARAFPPAHLTRLRELKRRFDPTGLFRDNFFIDPDEPVGPISGTPGREAGPADDH
jgi:FAD/FMN-containing dehydrogenase